VLRVGIAQMQPRRADVAANLDAIEAFVERAVAADVDLLVTPELALTGYPVGSWFSTASMTAASPGFGRLKELSRRVPMVVGLIEETEEAEFFNSAVYLDGGRVRHLHRKVYLPTYREFDERRYFMAGWSVSAFDTPLCRMGLLICGDAWHLSLPYLLAHDGADVIVVIAASARSGLTDEISARESWERMNRSYALTLSNFVVFANLVGDVDGMTFWGGSHVALPDGRLLDQAGFEHEELLVSNLDLSQLRRQRLILPFRRDDSLSLTTELGREVLQRKGQRVKGLGGDVASGKTGEPLESTAEPAFPPIGVSDLAFGGGGQAPVPPRPGEDSDAL
jgi:predicted amidohydrolase